MRLHLKAGKEIFRKVGNGKRVADLTFLDLYTSIQTAEVTAAKEQLAELRRINGGIDSNLTDAEAIMCQGMLRWLSGAIEEGIADLSRAVEISCPLGDYRLLSNIMMWRGCAHLDAGMAEKASRDFVEGRDYSQAMDQMYDSAILDYYSGLSSLRLGERQEAEERFKAVMNRSQSYQGFLGSTLRRFGLAGQAMLLAENRDFKASDEMFKQALGEPSTPSVQSIQEKEWRSRYAQILLMLERKEEASKESELAARILRSYGNEPKALEMRI
jgi:tetratricopeptide (TPR) repeat protein